MNPIRYTLTLTAILSLIPATGLGDVAGNWLWVTKGRNGAPDKESILHLGKSGSAYTGHISAPGAEGTPVETPVRDIQVDGDHVRFVVVREANGNSVTNRYEADLKGDSLVGKIGFTRNGQPGSRDWTAKNNGSRAVAATVAAPKPGYDEAGHKIVNETKYKSVSVDEAEAYLKEHPDSVVLDLRPPTNFAEGHIPNAKNLDLSDDADWLANLKSLDPKKRYVIHSVVGHYRTVRALEYFQANGFANAIAIEGGFAAWSKAGKPVVK
jgi:phage shock protein E